MVQSYTWQIRKDDGLHTFSLPSTSCSPSAQAFLERVLIMNDKGADHYIRASKAMIFEETRSDEIRKSFGWNSERTTFLLGNTLHGVSGAKSTFTALGQAAEGIAAAFKPVGDTEKWCAAAMEVASKPGYAAAGFLILLAAGSPLHSLMTEEGGTVIVYRSYVSGIGKSTTLAAAMSIWGRWRDLSIWSGSTSLSNSGKWEVTGHLPIAWEETVIEKDEELKARVLSFSDGQPRARMSRDGTQKAVGNAWSTFMLCTSNQDFRRRLGTMHGATEGPLARVLQLEPAATADPIQNDGGALYNVFSSHYGHAGPKIIEALLAVPGAVDRLKDDLITKNQERMRRLKLPSSARFTCRAITCAEAGGFLLKGTLLKDLDVTRIIRAAEDTLVQSVEMDLDTARGQDLAKKFVRDRMGDIIVVGPNMEQVPLRKLCARFEQTATGAKLIVPTDEWGRWCAKFNKSDKEAEYELMSLGHTVRLDKLSISEGTGYPRSIKTTCVVIDLDPSAAKDAVDDARKVVSILGRGIEPKKGKK